MNNFKVGDHVLFGTRPDFNDAVSGVVVRLISETLVVIRPKGFDSAIYNRNAHPGWLKLDVEDSLVRLAEKL